MVLGIKNYAWNISEHFFPFTLALTEMVTKTQTYFLQNALYLVS